MHNFDNQGQFTVYITRGRDLTVIQGHSGVLYPFYRSSGHNSGSQNSWFPWLGYFNEHPLLSHQIYMAKPPISDFSPEVHKILKEHLGLQAAENLILRMGNNEALALSCAIGGGVWNNEALKNAINECEALKSYRKELSIYTTIQVEMPLSDKSDREFRGKDCTVTVPSEQADVAEIMEKVTSQEIQKHLSTLSFSIQDRKEFPSQQKLDELLLEKNLSAARQVQPPLEENIAQARQIRERYLSTLGIQRDKENSNDGDKGIGLNMG